MSDNTSVSKLVEAVVRERFPDANIVSVEVIEDTDYEDDSILRVKVVFTAEADRLDSNATSSFVRHLRPKLEGIGVGAFPVMSFISQSDSGIAA